MRGNFVKGIMAGSIIGAAAGLMVIPAMDGKTRRKMRRKTKAVLNAAEGVYDNMVHLIR